MKFKTTFSAQLIYVFLFLVLVAPLRAHSQLRDSTNIIHQSRIGTPVQNKYIGTGYLLPDYTPVAFVSYGLIALTSKPLKKINSYLQEEILEEKPNYSTKVDDYLRYAPVVGTYAMDLLNIKGKNNTLDRTAIYLISAAINSSSVSFLKKNTRQLRPNGGSFTSFPSSHTAMAFAAAELFAQEYGKKSPWFAIAGYSAAATTGVLRMYNNAHWFSDVVAGAGIGILSTKVAYKVYPLIKNTIFKSKARKLRRKDK